MERFLRLVGFREDPGTPRVMRGPRSTLIAWALVCAVCIGVLIRVWP